MRFLTIINVKLFDEKASEEFGKTKKDLKDKKYLIRPVYTPGLRLSGVPFAQVSHPERYMP
jgi:hypothetical protein